MKQFFIMIFSLTFCFSTFSEVFENFNIGSAINLSEIEDSAIGLDINYPGTLSGVCGIEIRTVGRAADILEDITLSKTFGGQVQVSLENRQRVIHFQFKRGVNAYVVYLELKTKSGVSFKELVYSVTNRGALLVPGRCPKNFDNFGFL